MESWVLVGGLMTQAHASLNGLTSRATSDVDVLVDLMASSANAKTVIRSLGCLGFDAKEPGLRGSAFHRMTKDEMIVDVLIADHLPTKKQTAAKLGTWPLMETPGGAQAISRKTKINVASETRNVEVYIPNLLGALVLKCAAYGTDRRNTYRHLEDIALLASLITNHADVLEQMRGSDKKRIRKAAEALEDSSEPAWLKLPEEYRLRGQDTLFILRR
jgi:hypothetical protein